MTVNYNILYQDFLQAKFPNKLATPQVQRFLSQDKTALNLISINEFIAKENLQENKRHICFDEASIKEMLHYQEENDLTNYQTAKLYNISLTSLRKWKKHFQSIKNY